MSSRLRRQAYVFYLASRVYYCVDATLTLITLVCSSVAAGLSSTTQDHSEAVTGLSVASAIVCGCKQFLACGESSAVCRGVSRDLDRLAHEYDKGKITEDKRDQRVHALQRRLPVGTCFVLRL